MVSPLRQRVLDTADRLFYAEGIRAIGIDRLIEESGVAKASFYRFFASKDELITEWIQARDAAWRAWMAQSVAMLAPEAAKRPLAVFDAMYARFRTPDFRGCAFQNTIAELAHSEHPAFIAARAHKQAVIAMLEQYIAEAGYGNAAELAVQFMQLIDGALATALREQNPEAALQAKQMARLLLLAQAVSA
jgi:AcrR family transcriptional regulator